MERIQFAQRLFLDINYCLIVIKVIAVIIIKWMTSFKNFHKSKVAIEIVTKI